MKPALVTLTLLALAAVTTGCRAPVPSFRSSNLMSAFGSTRVPPPGTGSFVTASRYNDAATPTARSATNSSGWKTARQTNPPLSTNQPSGDTRVVPSITSGTSNRFTQASGSTTIRPAGFADGRSTTSTNNPSLRLNGMHVNDATTTSQPGQFTASSNFSQVPQASTNVGASVTRPRIQMASQRGSTLSSNSDSLGWHARSSQ